jgi:hypothetical protein
MDFMDNMDTMDFVDSTGKLPFPLSAFLLSKTFWTACTLILDTGVQNRPGVALSLRERFP